MILHVGGYVLGVKLKSDEKIVLENTKLVKILLVGSYIFEVKVKNHIREHKNFMILDVAILFWKYVCT